MNTITELRQNISQCNRCSLCQNGRSLPFMKSVSRFMGIAEAPGREEIDVAPLVGPAGRKLWEIMKSFGFMRVDFGLINTVQCRPLKLGKNGISLTNGKPTDEQMVKCSVFINKMYEILNPEKIIIFGNYARKMYFDGLSSGVWNDNGKIGYLGSTPVVLAVHPANVIYRGAEGEAKLMEAIKIFKEI